MLQSLLCMNLHTAGKVIGSVGTAVSFVAIIFLSTVVGHDVALSRLALQDYDYNSGVWLILTVLFFFSSILLIMGTMQNKHFLLLPWLLITGFFIITFARVAFPLYFKLMMPKTFRVQMMCNVVIGMILALKMYVYYGICSLVYHIRQIRAEGHSETLQNKNFYSSNLQDTGFYPIDGYPYYSKM
ncbi:uncharacterized protein LOC111518960 [Drosophila willistoni]|uniref:uncharacterized protein LOC111518960 n=1 Tax=Drosophila willistoni TaxID=7260 RepID=UPI000C26C880|nr:uncharacterized protein LOC111518960 [Drosophila willistoni]